MSEIERLLEEHCSAGVPFQMLGAIARVGTGSSDRKDAAVDGKYPFYVRSKDVFRIDSYEFDEEAVVIPGEGGIGEIFHYVTGKYALHQRAYRISLRGSSLETKFLYHYLRSRFRDFILSRAVTATVTSIRKPMITDFRVPIPPLEVQREIVAILDRMERLEAELEAELEARRRQYAYYRDALLTFDEAGGVRWVPMGELAGDGFFTDGDWVESKDQDPTGDVRLTQLADVGVDVFRDRSDRWLREDQAAALGCTFLEPQDVLIARMPDPLGRACQVPEGLGRAVTVVDVAILRCKRPDVLPRYVMYALNSGPLSRGMLSFQSGGTRRRISRGNLAKVRVPIPSIDEQHRVVDILDRFDAIVNDLSSGLPAEIAARRQQYEYYRDRLLSFEELAA